MKTILTVQHTEAEHHLSGHCGSRYEWALTERGLETAFRIGEMLKEETAGKAFRMYVSPQLRTRQTAEEMNQSLGLTPVFRDELRECDAGEGSGMSMEWYRANRAPLGPGFDPDYRPFPSAETDRELWARVEPFFREIMENDGENILVVSHGVTLSFLQSMLAGQRAEDRGRFRFRGRSGSVSKFTVGDDGQITAVYVNRVIE